MIEKIENTFSVNPDLEGWKFDTNKVFKYVNKREGEVNGIKGYLYDLEKYSYEEYVKILNEELVKANKTIEEQNLMIIDNTYRVTMIELAQQGISL